MKKKSREVSRHFRLPPREQSDLGTFLVPSPERDSEAGFGVGTQNLTHNVFQRTRVILTSVGVA
ncbi:hypothetical protein E2C01_026500 [Portunus trituberculatus]|uniref:Uncharacterized protein n=1 Tax=Portunus trituberculatus TaxID=210409 RepID=A0A5B7EIG7_PORTR|nr:hypothetical protein [Portunus trituberculatus]